LLDSNQSAATLAGPCQFVSTAQTVAALIKAAPIASSATTIARVKTLLARTKKSADANLSKFAGHALDTAIAKKFCLIVTAPCEKPTKQCVPKQSLVGVFH
jgi:hypothetical protein